MSLLKKMANWGSLDFASRLKKNSQWPFVRGPYSVVDPTAAVVVVTFGDTGLNADLISLAPPGLCMICTLSNNGKAVENFVHTLSSNLAIQQVMCIGNGSREGLGYTSVKTLLTSSANKFSELGDTLRESGIHLTATQVEGVCKQVQFSDLGDCTEIDKVILRLHDLSSLSKGGSTGFVLPNNGSNNSDKIVVAADTLTHEPLQDKAGYFKISVAGQKISVGHYNKKDELLRTIEGTNARSICLTLIRNGWVSRLDHAAYLGRELTNAQNALNEGGEYVQIDLSGETDADAGESAVV